MKPILERIEQLIALASSPNEQEARTAALLAVQMIRKHRVVLSLPPKTKTPSPATARRASPPPRKRSTPRAVKKVVDPPEKIVAPLGGDCIHCGGRYRADQPIFWFAASGGMHVRCFDDWAKK